MRRTKSYYMGCLLGGAIGDALGAPVEFASLDEIKEQYGKFGITSLVLNEKGVAEFTDDTQMTLFTAEGLLRANCRWMDRGGVCHLPTIVYRAYLRWFETQYGPGAVNPDFLNGWLFKIKELHILREPGRTCLDALRSDVMGTIKDPISNSKGCGGVMRVAPVGLSAFKDKFRIGCECAAITHGHPSGYIPAGMLAHIIDRLIRGDELSASIEDALLLANQYSGHEETTTVVKKAIDLANSNVLPEIAITSLGEGWVGEEALAIAIYCSLKFQDNFEQAIISAVNQNGDSDSTGAITGNILGAHLGMNAIPSSWIDVLELKNVIKEIANDLYHEYDQSLDWHAKYPGD